ncbi:MAG: ornithine carbamoyltransferase [Halococcoides sp.]
MTTDVLDIDDLTGAELHAVLDRAAELKAGSRLHEGDPPLANRTLAMLFEKPSTRTRTSFETGMTRLGGHAIFLGPDDIHLGHGEPIKDTSRALSGYVDAIMARLFDHEDAEELAAYASVPVINGLTDDAHPCQTLADLLTIRERFGGFEDVSVAWVGDGNNVASSFALGAAMVDLDLTVATPAEYALAESVLDRCAAVGSAPATTTDPGAAIADADVIYTDVWVSMGEEDERDEKLDAFEGFQITADRIGDRELMHCLPAHRGEEVTDGAIEHENSIVWQQAENRMHAQNGLLTWLLAE